MGTNFFTMNGTHIGKRSAAGYFCFDCKITLCKEGNEGVHHDKSEWHDSCPKCGKKPEEEKGWSNSAGLELGFNKNASEIKTGVKSCSSFTWAIQEGDLAKKRKVINEYGDVYSLKEFMRMVKSYPIHYKNFVGQWFR